MVANSGAGTENNHSVYLLNSLNPKFNRNAKLIIYIQNVSS